jgi:hypothetical protein
LTKTEEANERECNEDMDEEEARPKVMKMIGIKEREAQQK